MERKELCIHLISRADAKMVGLKRYFTGVPCPKGHVSQRVTNRAVCFECHRDSVTSYRNKNKDAIREKQREYFDKNRKEVNRKALEWYHGSDRSKEINANHCMLRRARSRVAKPLWYSELDEFVMLEAADLARRRSAITGIPWHIDHRIPFKAKKACGLHCADNIQVIPGKMNNEKKNRMIFTEPLEWLA